MCPGVLIDQEGSESDEYVEDERHGSMRAGVSTFSDFFNIDSLVEDSPAEINGHVVQRPEHPGQASLTNGSRVDELGDRPRQSPRGLRARQLTEEVHRDIDEVSTRRGRFYIPNRTMRTPNSSVGERGTHSQRLRNGTLNIQPLIQLQLTPLLTILRQHISRPPSLTSRSSRISADEIAISSIITYLQIAMTLSHALS
ncbi:hypothetical protein F4825DRAFT_329778 [Nemania diffusa]|nr:hypothetical protein F4825DRAFT_329778 [Nemania diffusa]